VISSIPDFVMVPHMFGSQYTEPLHLKRNTVLAPLDPISGPTQHVGSASGRSVKGSLGESEKNIPLFYLNVTLNVSFSMIKA